MSVVGCLQRGHCCVLPVSEERDGYIVPIRPVDRTVFACDDCGAWWIAEREPYVPNSGQHSDWPKFRRMGWLERRRAKKLLSRGAL
jgi:hypothetical protein